MLFNNRTDAQRKADEGKAITTDTKLNGGSVSTRLLERLMSDDMPDERPWGLMRVKLCSTPARRQGSADEVTLTAWLRLKGPRGKGRGRSALNLD